jgi:hypothetical protein
MLPLLKIMLIGDFGLMLRVIICVLEAMDTLVFAVTFLFTNETREVPTTGVK